MYKKNKFERAFRELFQSGRNTKDLGKYYSLVMFVKVNDFFYKNADVYGTGNFAKQKAFKSAFEAMDDLVRNANPNKSAVTGKTKKTRIKQALKQKAHKEWLKERGLNPALLDSVQNQYGYRVESLKKSIQEYIEKNNLEADLKSYGIKIADILPFK